MPVKQPHVDSTYVRCGVPLAKGVVAVPQNASESLASSHRSRRLVIGKPDSCPACGVADAWSERPLFLSWLAVGNAEEGPSFTKAVKS